MTRRHPCGFLEKQLQRNLQRRSILQPGKYFPSWRWAHPLILTPPVCWHCLFTSPYLYLMPLISITMPCSLRGKQCVYEKHTTQGETPPLSIWGILPRVFLLLVFPRNLRKPHLLLLLLQVFNVWDQMKVPRDKRKKDQAPLRSQSQLRTHTEAF